MPSKDTAQARQEDGIARAVDHSGEIWRTYATEFMRDFCRRNREVFCDDIWADGLERPPSPRAFGQIMKDAIRYGWIVKTDRFRPSVQSNNSARQIYESKLYRDETVRRIHSDKQPNQEKKQ